MVSTSLKKKISSLFFGPDFVIPLTFIIVLLMKVIFAFMSDRFLIRFAWTRHVDMIQRMSQGRIGVVELLL